MAKRLKNFGLNKVTWQFITIQEHEEIFPYLQLRVVCFERAKKGFHLKTPHEQTTLLDLDAMR